MAFQHGIRKLGAKCAHVGSYPGTNITKEVGDRADGGQGKLGCRRNGGGRRHRHGTGSLVGRSRRRGDVITLPLGSGLVVAGPIIMGLAGGGAGAVAGGIVGGSRRVWE